MEGMIPMNGQQDNLIDRFDGRALLDFYREPVSGRQTKTKTEDELELEEVRLKYCNRRLGWSQHLHAVVAKAEFDKSVLVCAVACL